MDTGRAPGTPQRDDVPDLGQRQSETPGLSDKRQQAHDLRGVAAVARRCATGRRQNAARLVQPEGLTAQATADRDLPDQEPLFHEGRIEPAPWGKVKRSVSGLRVDPTARPVSERPVLLAAYGVSGRARRSMWCRGRRDCSVARAHLGRATRRGNHAAPPFMRPAPSTSTRASGRRASVCPRTRHIRGVGFRGPRTRLCVFLGLVWIVISFATITAARHTRSSQRRPPTRTILEAKPRRRPRGSRHRIPPLPWEHDADDERSRSRTTGAM